MDHPSYVSPFKIWISFHLKVSIHSYVMALSHPPQIHLLVLGNSIWNAHWFLVYYKSFSEYSSLMSYYQILQTAPYIIVNRYFPKDQFGTFMRTSSSVAKGKPIWIMVVYCESHPTLIVKTCLADQYWQMKKYSQRTMNALWFLIYS